MVWEYYNPPFAKKDRALQKYMEKKTGNKEISLRIARIMNMYDYLVSHKFSSADEIHTSFFMGRDPIFSEKISKVLFKALKSQSGGRMPDEIYVIDKGVRNVLNYIRNYLPEFIVNFTDNAYPYITVFRTLDSMPALGPYVDIAKEGAVQTLTTGTVAADVAASDVAGPIGSAAVAVPAAIAMVLVVFAHILDDQLGEAFVASLLILPLVGPILYKMALSTGKFVHKLSTKKDAIAEIPVVGSVVNYLPDPQPVQKAAGKRFSTYRCSIHKCRRTTRRAKSNK